MRNKICFYSILCCFLVLCGLKRVISAEEKKVYIHPSFELCLKLYPRPDEIVNPMVPRIDAKSAFNLYKEGRAIFFAAGSSHQALIPGSTHVNHLEDPPIEFLKKHANRMIVIYCH